MLDSGEPLDHLSARGRARLLVIEQQRARLAEEVHQRHAADDLGGETLRTRESSLRLPVFGQQQQSEDAVEEADGVLMNETTRFFEDIPRHEMLLRAIHEQRAQRHLDVRRK